ncbi:cysteine sulfinate desulfinase [Yersinia kristensenii]|nr:cysteine sulfinate desulfinase [Yersinia kristensenii]
MKSFNPTDFRQEFPAINDEIIYLDSAATALKPRAMIEATQLFYQQDSATVHRSQHQSALSLTVRFEETRQQVAELLMRRTQKILFGHAAQPKPSIWSRKVMLAPAYRRGMK